MDNTENKELIIIPEKKFEPNQKEITQTYNEIFLIIKVVLLFALIMITFSLIFGLIK